MNYVLKLLRELCPAEMAALDVVGLSDVGVFVGPAGAYVTCRIGSRRYRETGETIQECLSAIVEAEA